MKKLKELKTLHSIFVDSVNELELELQNQIQKIKKEYQKNLVEEKLKLLNQICVDEGLNFHELKNKYFKSKEINQINFENTTVEKNTVDEDLLDKIEINGKEYYYEPKEKGKIYNTNSEIVGAYIKGKFTFD
jgi:hypothetical protein